jgi:hypothetical protein
MLLSVGSGFISCCLLHIASSSTHFLFSFLFLFPFPSIFCWFSHLLHRLLFSRLLHCYHRGVARFRCVALCIALLPGMWTTLPHATRPLHTVLLLAYCSHINILYFLHFVRRGTSSWEAIISISHATRSRPSLIPRSPLHISFHRALLVGFSSPARSLSVSLSSVFGRWLSIC